MSNYNQRPCSVPGCTATIWANPLACFADWQRVPVELREEVWRAWRAQGGDNPRAPSSEYIAACDAAIESVGVAAL